MEEKFLYSDRNEQVKRINRVLIFTYGIYFTLLTTVVVIAYLRGFRTLGYLLMTLGLEIGSLVGLSTIYVKKPNSEKLRWIALVALTLVGISGCYAFTSYYLRFAMVGPLVPFVLYYDKKFSRISGLTVGIVQIGTFIARCYGPSAYATEEAIDCAAGIGCVFAVVALCVYLESILERFQGDTIGLIQYRADMQAEMLEEVTAAAAQAAEISCNNKNLSNNTKELLEKVQNTAVTLDKYSNTESVVADAEEYSADKIVKFA